METLLFLWLWGAVVCSLTLPRLSTLLLSLSTWLNLCMCNVVILNGNKWKGLWNRRGFVGVQHVCRELGAR